MTDAIASVTFPCISAMSFSDTGRGRGVAIVIVPGAGAGVVLAASEFVRAYFDASTKGEISATGHSPGDSPTISTQ